MNHYNLKSTAYLFFLFVLLCIGSTSVGQGVFQFKEGLAAEINVHYGREALYSDPLAHQFYNGTLKKPVAGEVFGNSDKGTPISWKAVTADSTKRLVLRGAGRGGGFGRSGYIYLTYTSDKDKNTLLTITGNNSVFVNGVLHAGDPYSSGWLHLPIRLKKGLNEFYVRSLAITASLSFPTKDVLLNTEDPTMPTLQPGIDKDALYAAIMVINNSQKELKGLQLINEIGGKKSTSPIPSIPALSVRKIQFSFDPTGISSTGKYNCQLVLTEKNKVLDEAVLIMEAVASGDKYSVTFESAIDGSLQYYAVTPQISPKKGAALFLSVHGAGVEALGQARAYKSKDWGTLVAATNRRPRGFNWEDWGRLDALEVLQLGRTRFEPDPQHIYLTGHSMGGHGTWFLGATYPDKWAAIAPCSGYPTLKGYGSADGLIPDSSSSPMEQLLLRSGNQSDVPKLASNYKPLGVYVLHGDNDQVVSVNYARQMRKQLGEFHTDMSYYEYPGGEHWFGDQSVDWGPLFSFFKWHERALDSNVNVIDFKTSSPGISSSYRWASIEQQDMPLQYSRIQLKRNSKSKSISGVTENVRLLKLDLQQFGANASISISLDNGAKLEYKTKNVSDIIYLLQSNGQWTFTTKPDSFEKGPHRYGTFKEAFNNRMVFVYGTIGAKEENEWNLNKAKFDAETWYYRGNGAVDIVTDKEFSLAKYKDRGVIIYGNKSSNAAWNSLLTDCPIQVERNKITAGDKQWTGDDLGAYFVWPIRSSSIASVAVIAGTGLKGMNTANANQYFAGASGFPDFMIFSSSMLLNGAGGMKMTGFYDWQWRLDKKNLVISE